jgi:hypothetical protein
MLSKEAGGPGPEPFRHHRVGHQVGEPGQGEQLEVLAGAEQGVGEFEGVPEIDVVVAGAVHEEERAAQLVGVGQQGGGWVDGAARDRKAEVAFGVVGIVVEPVGDRRPGHGGVIDIGPAQHRQGRQVAAKGPAGDAHAAQIQFREPAAEGLEPGHLIRQRDGGEIAGDRPFPRPAAPRCAAAVE